MRAFRTPLATALAIAATLLAPAASAAPRSWLLPSETMFTGSGDEWLTVDAAMSTDLYYYDHPAQPWNPVATAPDGTPVQVENKASGKLRTVFDLHITQKGTYKIAVNSTSVFGFYMLAGERKMLPRGTTPETLAGAIPAGATDVTTAESTMRLETFVTAGEPTTTVFTPTGKGLEMVPVSHPNDLSVGEAATFQFLLDGKPAANLPVIAVPGGVRYRSGVDEIDAVTDANGKVTITWPTAGMYWVSASVGAQRGEGGPGGGMRPGAAAGGQGAPAPEGPPPAPQRRATYAMTVEVLG